MVVSPGVELALRRALVAEVPDFVSAVTAEGNDSAVTLTIYHLPTVRSAWRREFEEVVESEFEQHVPREKRTTLKFAFRPAADFGVVGPMCILHRRP
jgi:hypothetical protein